jgi:DNA topoisomerase-1
LWNRPVAKICPDCSASYLIEKNTKRHGRQLVCDSESCSHAEAVEA